ncbi:MAG: glycosyltransferase family 4 protein, partial [Geminicoccales bacterium]
MKLLFIHNRYAIQGGEEESFEAEIRLLRDMGHEVDVYEETNERVLELGRAQVALRAIWSRQAYRELRWRLSRARYDIVHVQNFFPLISPAAHHAARAEGVRVVQSVR